MDDRKDTESNDNGGGRSTAPYYTCAWCGMGGVDTQCGRCADAAYCDARCQAAHWPQHAAWCDRQAAALVESALVESARQLPPRWSRVRFEHPAVSEDRASAALARIGAGHIDQRVVPPRVLAAGMTVELEHSQLWNSLTNVTDNDDDATAKIALAHLIESPLYYRRLADMERAIDADADPRPSIFRGAAARRSRQRAPARRRSKST